MYMYSVHVYMCAYIHVRDSLYFGPWGEIPHMKNVPNLMLSLPSFVHTYMYMYIPYTLEHKYWYFFVHFNGTDYTGYL